MRSWLITFRKDRDLTQKQVAERSGVQRSYYTMIENDSRTPSVKVAKRIGSALGFDWTIFFEEQSNETTPKENEKAGAK
ncbi:helix-turn-helix transcriptional regulator [Tetragenococcus halophilus]|uniref:helix-turn-helix transcriptional regulator n=1 Tax=Tetragenococcus halophilus TaxID=51669 RepID=UPI002A968BC1|nr:helix-turn-helix transcriptional regulator [Tetragenococcus halophilus]